MPVSAQRCPNCSAPLTVVDGLCAFCRVPIATTSEPVALAATGARTDGDPAAPFALQVTDVFSIVGRGTVVVGRVAAGRISVGDQVVIEGAQGRRPARCNGVEMFRKKVDVATAGDNVGLLLEDVAKSDVVSGDWILAPG
jgi:translation elongation factor EF-Tu-like GTPase